ncbi:hypothetical protein CALVIDRAFT_526502 [Calocera viscosa TUFC12733]|uniref:Uncharacterized protein n=1 Tax=Calocera viscosa (strain TUFC12733) TaxID=1330018 RepID=A0A167NIE2_CALVF|nr:hypothetical protein CALVIDRAFT_526502 [Calocera viscosa TUFC12733]
MSASYSDKFVTVDGLAHTLTIHNYRITHPTLTIPLSSIVYLLPAAQITKRLGMKAWGLGITGVSWARDWERMTLAHREEQFERCFVVKFHGALFRAGFSVEDREAFVDAVERAEPGLMGRKPGEGEMDDVPNRTTARLDIAELGGVSSHPWCAFQSRAHRDSAPMPIPPFTMADLPPVDRTIASWELWQTRTEHLPSVVASGLASIGGAREFEARRKQWIQHTQSIYAWNARRAGEWEFVHGGIGALLKEYRDIYMHADIQSQERAYWDTCDVAELLLNFHLRNGHEEMVTEVIRNQ